jgi:hypothetical protein
LTSGANSEEDIRQPTSPVPEALARRLLASEAGGKTSPQELAAAGERIYLRLRERLAVVLGSIGFDTLWARAMHLSQRQFPSANDTAAEESFPTHAYGLHTAMRGRDSAAIHHNLVVVFTSFIRLLFTFIGEELSLHFIRQLWPELPPDAAESHTEGATQ